MTIDMEIIQNEHKALLTCLIKSIVACAIAIPMITFFAVFALYHIDVLGSSAFALCLIILAMGVWFTMGNVKNIKAAICYIASWCSVVDDTVDIIEEEASKLTDAELN